MRKVPCPPRRPSGCRSEYRLPARVRSQVLRSPFACGQAARLAPEAAEKPCRGHPGPAGVAAGKVQRARPSRSARGRARGAGAGRTRPRTRDGCEENNKIAGAPAGRGARATCSERGAYTFKAGPAPPLRPPAARAAAPAPRRPPPALRLRCCGAPSARRSPLSLGAGSGAPRPLAPTAGEVRGGRAEAVGRGAGRLPG